jgi:hypothetical protein
MVYYLVQLVDPTSNQVLYRSLDKVARLPSKSEMEKNPGCILTIRTGELFELKETPTANPVKDAA